MKLSVYVNLRSIAWVVSQADEIIANGIKRVMIDFDSYYEYIAGLPVSKRINRRIKRSMRRNLSRYKNRRLALARLIGKPDSVYPEREMLLLRVKALEQKVTQEELTAIFFSLQAKRGYKSMRGVLGEGDYLAQIKEHEERMADYKSAAEYLLSLPSTKNVVLTRGAYEAEFFAICEAQGVSNELQHKLHNIIYYQRPLKKGKVAKCKLESNRPVCHASHPDYIHFRILRDVNNIVITDRSMDEVVIPAPVRFNWVLKLRNGGKITKASCLRDLGIKKSAGYSWLSGKQISGDPMPYLSREVWQEIFSATDDEKLRRLLFKKYGSSTTTEEIEGLIDYDVSALGWGEYSHKAIMALMPHLKDGLSLKEAILNSYGVVDMAADATLRNLVVEQHFESYKSLVSKIRKEFDITESVIEISHLLKAGNKSRKQMARSKRADKAYKQKHATLTDYQQHLLKLHEEFDGISPYEPSVKITTEELFSNYNVDHIVPKSKLFEHGMSNQCLCRKDLNERKGSLTGIEFARQLGIEDAYRGCVDNLKVSERKKQFLLMETNNIPADYLNTDDYNTRCFASVIDAVVIPNRIINKYHRDWEFEQYPENDIRDTLTRCVALANFDKESIAYFNNLKNLPNTSIGRYNLTPSITASNIQPYTPYVPRLKFYRKDKHHPRFGIHDESIFGKRKEFVRNTKGEVVENIYFKIRKPVASLTPAMIGKIMDGAIRRKFAQRIGDRKWEDVLPEILEDPITHNGKPIRSVSIRINANKLVKLPRGYAYSALNHRIDSTTGKPVQLIDYLNGDAGRGIKKQDVIKYKGEYFFASGISDIVTFRSVYELNAVDAFRSNKTILKDLEIVRVDELGRVVKSERF